MISKGGITSHDVALHGLGIRRAEVLGKLLDGRIEVGVPAMLVHVVVSEP